MQYLDTGRDTFSVGTVVEPMEKRGQISGERSGKGGYPNAAPLDQVEAVQRRVEALGLEWHASVKEAGISRNTGYKLLRGEGSVGSLRRLEEWLVKKEAGKATERSLRPKEQWAAIGDELESLGEDDFNRMIDGLNEFVRAEKRRREALVKILRPTSGR